jgi:hypothetical protein
LVSNALSADPAIDEFVITIPNSHSDSDIDVTCDSTSSFASNSIAALERLISGETCTLSESQFSEMGSLCEFVGNADLREPVIDFLRKAKSWLCQTKMTITSIRQTIDETREITMKSKENSRAIEK